MNCETAKEQLVLLAYGELTFDEEEALEQHLDGCLDCRADRVKLERVAGLLEQGEPVAPAGLLLRCRRDLSERIGAERSGAGRWLSAGDLWRRWVVHPPLWARPLGAAAMLAVGFLGARLVPADSPALARMGVPQEQPAVVSRVRLVNPDNSGRVRVLYDEVRQRELTGALNDDHIRRLLLTAAIDPADPGIRVDSIDLLKQHCSNDIVRKALLNALRSDTNAGVRLKALEGLTTFARDPETRKVLAQVVLTDDNPGVRTQAIDLLVQNKQPEVAGVLQELLRREENSYVRSRSQKALSEMKASVGTF
ncbi:MAG: HEAT repeat domain-containing protein [Candidatus Solibacter usitatus]|nr:HEAT repeat domain-containing protein [Candidatus Solibacter usitatus]